MNSYLLQSVMQSHGYCRKKECVVPALTAVLTSLKSFVSEMRCLCSFRITLRVAVHAHQLSAKNSYVSVRHRQGILDRAGQHPTYAARALCAPEL